MAINVVGFDNVQFVDFNPDPASGVPNDLFLITGAVMGITCLPDRVLETPAGGSALCTPDFASVLLTEVAIPLPCLCEQLMYTFVRKLPIAYWSTLKDRRSRCQSSPYCPRTSLVGARFSSNFYC